MWLIGPCMRVNQAGDERKNGRRHSAGIAENTSKRCTRPALFVTCQKIELEVPSDALPPPFQIGHGHLLISRLSHGVHAM